MPTEANLREAYGSFAELVAASDAFSATVNARPHAETRRPPVEMLAEERAHCHILPTEPFVAALGEARVVRDDQTIRFGSVRYSTPKPLVGKEVFARVEGEELVIVARTEAGIAEVARHRLSTPGRPVINDEHYPDHPTGNGPPQRKIRPEIKDEKDFLAIGEGAERWLREACGAGVARIRAKMAQATQLASFLGADLVDRALGVAALAGRFAEDDLASIAAHLEAGASTAELVVADEAYSTQVGTSTWEGFGR